MNTTLYIHQRGTKIFIANGMLCIQKPEEKPISIPIGDVSALCVGKSISITSDVLFKLADMKIDFWAEDRQGMPLARWMPVKSGNIATLRKNQLQFAEHAAGRQWVRNLIREKIENQIRLFDLLENCPKAYRAGLNRVKIRMKELPLRVKDTENIHQRKELYAGLRALEAQAARLYWHGVNLHLPDMYRFSKRTKHPAEDIFNAALNYTYGILYRMVEAALLKAGFDVQAGIFHSDEYQQPALAFDVIEKFRYWADYMVISLFQQYMFDPVEFNHQKHRMSDFMKRSLAELFHDFMNELITINDLSRTRETHIQLYAQHFAQTLKNFKP